MNNKERVLIYSAKSYIFRSTIIGYLHEISQVYPVILLSEKLDSETEGIIKNKRLFPKLEKIIPISQFTEEKIGLFSRNKDLFQKAKDVIREYSPNVVLVPNDMYPLELYLLRFAKKINALIIALQPSNAGDGKELTRWVDLINITVRFPRFLPSWLKVFLMKLRKYSGHFLYYWILPLTILQRPFPGKSSHILRRGNSGMRNADFQTVFSKRDYNIFLKDGVTEEKLYILAHPLKRGMRKIFEEIHSNQPKKKNKRRKIISLMISDDTAIGFDKNNNSLLVDRGKREKDHISIVELISETLPEWDIYVKIHPDYKNPEKLKKEIENVSSNVKVVRKKEAADKIIELSDVIVGAPLSTSTTLFTASFQCPEKPILSLDFHKELLGDFFKNFEGIEYIDNKEEFVEALKKIMEGIYKKDSETIKNEELEGKEFSDSVDMIKKLLKQKTS